MDKSNKELGGWQAKQVGDTFRLGYWTAAWLVTMAAAKFGPELVWQSNELISSLAILINLGVGFGMILANKRCLEGMDEMQQKINLEAMGLTLGVGLVVGLGYSGMNVNNLIAFDDEILLLTILMSVTYILGIFAGHWKYR